ncbi:MAG TPA: SDR family NAD(P)-dependent oxidoreductase [Candidatus Acidoferrales bacterium]|nr:SDR family NAD(P)-dependent oxidoreductase [Candidatus Acidoferrales bacterium]
MNISGNTILITGGATGIGYAFAESFLAEKNEVIICGRRKERLLEVQKKHPEVHIRVCDVADEADRKSLVEWATSSFPKLNILINNAGIQRDVDFTKGVDEFLAGESEIKINLEAPIILSGMVIPYLTGKKDAAIINVSSGLGFIPAARMPVYSATKAALHAFSMALRHQLLKTGIKVIEVVPPGVDTELNPEGRAKRGNYKAGLTPEEFVAAVMKSLKADVLEIGHGMTEGAIKASRAELDESFKRMNSRW